MNTHEEKMSLLSEMVSFSLVDGRLHIREYEFLLIVARELQISKEEFDDLFQHDFPKSIINPELERIQQFYRLALLMHIDGVLHEKEETAIRQIAINMGLNPAATKRILRKMKESPDQIIDAGDLLVAFREQHN